MQKLEGEKQIFEELLNNYEKNIEEYDAVNKETGKTQKHRKLKDNNYEKELNNLIKKTFSENKYLNKDINVRLKLGVPYNRVDIPWIQLYYMEKNAKGTKGNYAGISLDVNKKNVELWIRLWYDRHEKI